MPVGLLQSLGKVVVALGRLRVDVGCGAALRPLYDLQADIPNTNLTVQLLEFLPSG